MISSLVSLYEESPRSILNRAVVIHELPDDRARARKVGSDESVEDSLLACGLLRWTGVEDVASVERESILLGLERPFKIEKIEQDIFDGKQSWENVRHPYFGAVEGQKVPSNLNLEGLERPDISVDKLTLETAAPTRKGNFPH